MTLFAGVVCAIGCQSRPDPKAPKGRLIADYDDKNQLRWLTYDSNGNGKMDTWSEMDGTRVVSVLIDVDEDGRIDRWEFYKPDGKLDAVGMSRANNGQPDVWVYRADDGQIAKIGVSTEHNGKANRWEYYEKGALARVEEDTDGDGKADKWQTYSNGALTTAALDLDHDGRPDRLLTYSPKGELVRIDSLTATSAAQAISGFPVAPATATAPPSPRSRPR